MATRNQAGGIGRDAAVVRRAGPSDVHAIADLWARAGLPHAGRGFRKEVARLRRRDPELLLIALRSGELVGAIAGSYDGRTAILSRLAVAEDARHQGIATALVRALLRQFGHLGAGVERLLVVDDVPGLDEFWTSLGMRRAEPVACFHLDRS